MHLSMSSSSQHQQSSISMAVRPMCSSVGPKNVIVETGLFADSLTRVM
jgi:hypothetical protein